MGNAVGEDAGDACTPANGNDYCHARTRLKMCCHCGENIGSKTCGHCRKATYCSGACQRAGWEAGHKEVCQKRVLQEDGAHHEVTSSAAGRSPPLPQHPAAGDLQAVVEVSLRDLEADARGVPANMGVADHLIRTARENNHWRIIILECSRSPQILHQRLMRDSALEPCIHALQERGFSPELASGAKIFVQPDQFEAVVDTPQVMSLKPWHIVIAQELEYLVARVIHSLPSRQQVREKGRAMVDVARRICGHCGACNSRFTCTRCGSFRFVGDQNKFLKVC